MKRRQRGGAAVEIGLCLMPLVLLITGTIEAGRVVWVHNFVTYAAREASRYASVRGATSGAPADQAALTALVAGQAASLDPAKLAVLVQWQPDNQPGSRVEVKVSYAYTTALSLIFGGTLNLSATSRMTISQ